MKTKKEGEEQEKGDKREEGKKKTGMPFNFYIVYSSEKKKTLEQSASSLTLSRYKSRHI